MTQADVGTVKNISVKAEIDGQSAQLVKTVAVSFNGC
jgi:hypothetical protein